MNELFSPAALALQVIYNHVISNYVIPMKTSQLKPVQMQQCLFDGDCGQAVALSSFLRCHYFWKHSN